MRHILLLLFMLIGIASASAQAPLSVGTYRDNPLSLTYHVAGLQQAPTITAVLLKDANGLPIGSAYQPRVTVTTDPAAAGQFLVSIRLDSTGGKMPVNSYLMVKMNGQTVAAGPVVVDRSNRSGSYTFFINTITLYSSGNSGGGSGTVDLSGVYNLIDGKVSKIIGKGLSTLDFTTAYRNRLDSLAYYLGLKANVGQVSGGTSTSAVQPTFVVGAVSRLAAGSLPTFALIGGPVNFTINVGLPDGATGQPGVQGLQGLSGTAGTNGTNGLNGVDGVTPVFSVSVVALASGAAPTVTQGGNAAHPTLLIGIPAGPAGSNANVPSWVSPTDPGYATTGQVTQAVATQAASQTAVDQTQNLAISNNSTAIGSRLTQLQVSKTVGDSLAANTTTYTGDFIKKPDGSIGLTTPNGTTATTDAAPTANSPNPVASGGVYAALQQRAPAAHTQAANTISDFNSAVAAYLQSLTGFGAGTVLSSNMSWVSATSGTPLTQLSAPVLTVGSVTASTVPLSWTAVPNALTYVVQQAIDAQFSNGLLDAYTGSTTNTTLSGLVSAQQFFYRIKAKASGFADSDYGFATATTTGTAPGTLATPVVTLTSSTSNSIGFSWGAVTNATVYSLTLSTNSALTNGASFTTTALAYAPSATPSTTYYIGVVAQAPGFASSAVGTANGTTSASATAGASTTALGTTSLAFASITSSGASASWTAVPNASGYILQRATDSGFTAGLSSTTLGNVTTATLSGLTAATPYFNRIKATGTGNYTDGAYSAVTSFTTSAAGGSTTALVAASQLYLNGATTTSIAASWTMSANVTAGSGNSYQFELSTSNTFASVLSTVNSGTVAQGTFTGLTPNTTYYLRMKALGTGSFTDSPYSGILSVVTSATVAGTYAVERAFKVNLSTSSNSGSPGTGWFTVAPALASIATGYVSPVLSTTDGTSTGVSFSIVSGFSGGGVNYFSGTANVPNAVWPALAMNRGWTYPQAGGSIRISGLTAGKYYQLYVLSSNVSSTQASYATITAGGVVGGIRYIPGNGVEGPATDTAGPSLLIANNLQAASGFIDLTITRPQGTSNQPMQGFILLETNIPR